LLINQAKVEEYLRLNIATKYDNPNNSSLPKGWKALDQSGETDDWLGYFGRAYVKDDQLVISSRGSVDVGDELQYPETLNWAHNIFTDYLINDVHGVYFFRGPYQITSAEEYYLYIKQTYGHQYNITLTGFSLGGTITYAICHKYGLSCTVFDMSGDKEIMKYLEIPYNILAKISVIQSNLNIVNTHGSHSTSPFYIEVPYSANSTSIFDFIAETTSVHNMDNMLKHLPKGIKQSSHWPKVEEAFNNFVFSRHPSLHKSWTQLQNHTLRNDWSTLDIDNSNTFCTTTLAPKNNLHNFTDGVVEKFYEASQYCDDFLEFINLHTTDNVYKRPFAELYGAVSDKVSSYYSSLSDAVCDLGKSISNVFGDHHNE
jgi:hypothetical protein